MYLFSLFLAVLLLLAEPLTPVQAATIQSVSYGGSGTPAGSVAENISPDSRASALLFNGFVAEAGPGVPLGEATKNTSIIISLLSPAGIETQKVTVVYRGFSSLENGFGTLRANGMFEGVSLAEATSSFGPFFADDYMLTHEFTFTTTRPTQGETQLVLNAVIDVSRPGQGSDSGLMTVDSFDLQLSAVPEPNSMVVFSIGILSVVVLGRSRKGH